MRRLAASLVLSCLVGLATTATHPLIITACLVVPIWLGLEAIRWYNVTRKGAA